MNSLASIMPYYIALINDVDPVSIGLARKDCNSKSAFVQCLDLCKCKNAGTVALLFQVKINSLQN
jgi:hypothetical protein